MTLLYACLAFCWHSLHPAKTGLSALKTMTTEKPDLVLLDIMLPDVDGFDVCRKIKNNAETQAVPVFFVTPDSSRKCNRWVDTKKYLIGCFEAKAFSGAVVEIK